MSEIVLADVRRLYGRAAAVDGVSLRLPSGKITALLGPSGSGKSTILRLIAGLETVDGGEVRIDDETVSTPGRTVPPEARRVGVVFQDYALFPHLSAQANVEFGLAHLPKSERASVARTWLGRVGLEHRAEAFPHALSGGEQQRVALARALAPSPRAVLLDEPFSGLDPVLRSDLRDTTLDALRAANATAVFVTHDAEEALYVADRLAILKSGKLLQDGAPRDVYAKPANADAAAALGPVNLFSGSVENGRVITPFGAVSTTLSDSAQVVVRAEALIIAPGQGARVIDVRPQGAADLVRVEAGGLVWRAATRDHVSPGDSVAVSIDPAGAFVFSGAP